MAGDATTRSAEVKSRSSCPPRRKSIGRPSSCAGQSASLSRRAVGHQDLRLRDQPAGHGDPSAEMAEAGDGDALAAELL